MTKRGRPKLNTSCLPEKEVLRIERRRETAKNYYYKTGRIKQLERQIEGAIKEQDRMFYQYKLDVFMKENEDGQIPEDKNKNEIASD